MSVESSDLDRSALERKDRAELQTIAQALGGRPGSRAKKADIVDLILELAGAGPSSARPVALDDSDDDADDGDGFDGPEADDDTVDASDDDGDDDVVDGRSGGAKGSDADEAAAERDDADGEADDDEPDKAVPAPSRADGGRSSQGRQRGADGGRGQQGQGQGQGRGRRDQAGRDGASSDANQRDQQSGGQRDGNQGGGNRDANQRDQQGTNQRDANQRDANQRDANQQGGSQQGQRDANQQGGGQQGQRAQGQGGQGQGGQGQGDHGGAGDQGDGLDGDSGNRRRRRRRGRDRGDQVEGQGGGDQWDGEPVDVEGLLDLREEGYGFLRVHGYLPSKDDAYVSVKQCRQLGLRRGDTLTGKARPAGRNEKNPAMLQIDAVNGDDPETARARPRFEDLTPLFPDERLRLERPADPSNMTARIVDLVSPIGKGQRGLIVSPPKAGKTTIMKQIAQSMEANNPEAHLMVLLVDERPEEVTDMRRSVTGEVIASTFDRPAEEHTVVAELTIERAKRLVEQGRDVVIILDGITRLARAYNLAAPATGRIMSGGIDTGALYPPKKFFGAARNVEEGGSLTILATALVETGSRMDEVIFEEFKGTGNMELRLDRRLAERRIYPAIDVDASSTRHEELLFERRQLQQVWKLRRVLSGLAGDGGAGAGLELLIDRMRTFPSNDEFLAEIARVPGVA